MYLNLYIYNHIWIPRDHSEFNTHAFIIYILCGSTSRSLLRSHFFTTCAEQLLITRTLSVHRYCLPFTIHTVYSRMYHVRMLYGYLFLYNILSTGTYVLLYIQRDLCFESVQKLSAFVLQYRYVLYSQSYLKKYAWILLYYMYGTVYCTSLFTRCQHVSMMFFNVFVVI